VGVDGVLTVFHHLDQPIIASDGVDLCIELEELGLELGLLGDEPIEQVGELGFLVIEVSKVGVEVLSAGGVEALGLLDLLTLGIGLVKIDRFVIEADPDNRTRVGALGEPGLGDL